MLQCILRLLHILHFILEFLTGTRGGGCSYLHATPKKKIKRRKLRQSKPENFYDLPVNSSNSSSSGSGGNSSSNISNGNVGVTGNGNKMRQWLQQQAALWHHSRHAKLSMLHINTALSMWLRGVRVVCCNENSSCSQLWQWQWQAPAEKHLWRRQLVYLSVSVAA